MTEEEKRIAVTPKDIIAVAALLVSLGAILWQGGQLTERVNRNTTLLIRLNDEMVGIKAQVASMHQVDENRTTEMRDVRRRLEKIENTVTDHLMSDYNNFQKLEDRLKRGTK